MSFIIGRGFAEGTILKEVNLPQSFERCRMSWYNLVSGYFKCLNNKD